VHTRAKTGGRRRRSALAMHVIKIKYEDTLRCIVMDDEPFT
jgi:hypothetical protein